MGITIKTVRGIAVTNLIVLGLASCSSTPAPWTQENESPWGAKHEAEAQSGTSDQAISDTSLNDPVLLADTEPEAIAMEAPEAAPAPEVIIAVIVEDEPVETSLDDELELASVDEASADVEFESTDLSADDELEQDAGLELEASADEIEVEFDGLSLEVEEDSPAADEAELSLEDELGAEFNVGIFQSLLGDLFDG